MCARVAIPANYQANFPQDPGYTVKQHLNSEGVTVQDDIIYGYDGQPVDLDPPKLCLYKDPAFFSFEDGFDIMDLDPNKQAAHKTSELHPVIKVILFLVDMAVQLAQAPLQLMDALITMIAGDDAEGETTFASVLKSLFEFVGWLIEKFGEGIAAILRSIGQINRSVDDTSYGCVPIPLGPYPPPFCPTISPLFQTAYTQKICRTEGGSVLSSTRNEPCVVSTLENNFVRNSIRITFNNFVPLCKPGEISTDNDKCVIIENLDAFPSAHLLHLGTSNTDIIPLCTGGITTPCVNTTIAVPDSCVGSVCSKVGFRIVYGLKLGEISSPQSYFINRDDLPSCPASSSASCQEVWGVNTSGFVDVSLTFPVVQSVPDISTLSEMVSLTSDDGKVSNFNVSIVRKSAYDGDFGFFRNPKQICVTKGTEIFVGCEDRAPFTKPQVYNCPYGGVSCTSSYFAPKFVASVASGGDRTSAKVEPKSMYNTTLSFDPSIINLAGFQFSSFVTDNTSIKAPFSGTHSPNPGSIFGNYLNDIFPVNASNGAENTNAIYLYGLEYINEKYLMGGTRACLENLDLEKCPKNTTNCVLTNLLNRNTVDCKEFMTTLAQYSSSVNRCTATEISSCGTAVNTISGIPPSAGISILACPSGSHCYTSPIDADLCQGSTLLSDRYIPSPSSGATLEDHEFYPVEPIGQTTNNVICTPIDGIVNCTNFVNKLASYPGIGRCNEEQTTRCSYIVDTIPALISGDNGASIRLCDSGIHCYTSPTNEDLCQESTCTGETPTGYNFPQNQYILRDKTSYEMGLCTTISQPNCAAVTNYTSQDDGYAIWPETQVGHIATGTCRTGDIAVVDPLQRWCVPNPENQTFSFSKLYTRNSSGAKVYSDVRCKPYQITLSSRTDTFPSNYPRSTTSNANNYSGNLTLGGYDYAGATVVSAGYYSSTVTFNIPDVTSNIDYFRITSMANDDFALVKVNNVAVYSSPSTSLNCGNANIPIGSFKAMSYNNNGTATLTKTAGGSVTIGDTCAWNRSKTIFSTRE
ncbi:MAG: hypothetical protein AB8B68_00115 [Rickettsiaceae bacterium]